MRFGVWGLGWGVEGSGLRVKELASGVMVFKVRVLVAVHTSPGFR